MFDVYGRHIPDYPGQQPWQDPAYIRNLHQQAANMQLNGFQNGTSPQPTQQPPVQSSAPISVRGEQQALDWPIAPGNSLTFIDESAGYVYTKTSLNQFDRPQFVKYKLVREDVAEASASPTASPQATPAPTPVYALQSDVEAISGAVEAMKNELQDFRDRLDYFTTKKPATRKKEDSVEAVD